MWLKNYRILDISNKYGFSTYYDSSNGKVSASYNSLLDLKASDGTLFGIDNYVPRGKYVEPVTFIKMNSDSSKGVTLSFGSDNTAVTEDDYKLGSELTNTILQSIAFSSSTLMQENPTKFQILYTRTVKNITAEDIIVKEFGIFKRIDYAYTTDEVRKNNLLCLLYREVLETPITIAAGETKTITVTLDF